MLAERPRFQAMVDNPEFPAFGAGGQDGQSRDIAEKLMVHHRIQLARLDRKIAATPGA